MQFCEWLQHQHAADELFLHSILWTDEACFTHECVFNIHKSHLWARDNPHAIRERGYQVHFSIIVWAGIIGDVVVGPYLLTDRLTAQQHCDFLETSTEAASCEAEVVVLARQLQCTMGKMSGSG
jgi:hypothetical protein